MYQSVKIYDKMQRSVPFGGGAMLRFALAACSLGLIFLVLRIPIRLRQLQSTHLARPALTARMV